MVFTAQTALFTLETTSAAFENFPWFFSGESELGPGRTQTLVGDRWPAETQTPQISKSARDRNFQGSPQSAFLGKVEALSRFRLVSRAVEAARGQTDSSYKRKSWRVVS